MVYTRAATRERETSATAYHCSSNSLVWSFCCVAHLDVALEMGVPEESLGASWLLTSVLPLGTKVRVH